MFSLTISFGPAATMWTFMFREQKTAHETVERLDRMDNAVGGKLFVTDEFGQVGSFQSNQIHGYMLEDMNLSKAAHIERALHQARLQGEAQTMAENDATLRAHRARTGTAIIDPMGRQVNGGFGPMR